MNPIYNPKDLWHNPYFVVTDSGIYRNLDCALSEKDYETLCRIKGINPIYPPESISVLPPIPVVQEVQLPKEKVQSCKVCTNEKYKKNRLIKKQEVLLKEEIIHVKERARDYWAGVGEVVDLCRPIRCKFFK